MATNLAIDPNLLDDALAISGLSTKKDTVNLKSSFGMPRKPADYVAHQDLCKTL